MTKSTTNTQANVSAAKGFLGGYVYSAPIGTTLPTDYSSELDPAFVNLGYLSEDGITQSLDEDIEEHKDMNGDIIDTSVSKHVRSAELTFVEIKAETLKRMFGETNVTDSNGMITIKENEKWRTPYAYVFDLVLKDERRWRKVVSSATPAEAGEMVFNATDLCGCPLTLNYDKNSDGDSCLDYIQSTETSPVL